MGLIGLITDFGLKDEYVGVMKAVILGRAPQATIVDVCHGVDPQDVLQAAYVLEAARRYFPAGSLHVVVVDPGVGTERAILIVEAGGQRFLAPDNGVLSFVLEPAFHPRCRILEPAAVTSGPVSATFHGRDLIAPAAGLLANGLDPEALGPEIPASKARRLEGLRPERTPEGALAGRVIHIDRFGNLITNIAAEDLPAGGAGVRIEAGGVRLEGLHRTYAEAPPGGLIALVGSRGLIEIAAAGGHAANRTGIEKGAPVLVEIRRGEPAR